PASRLAYARRGATFPGAPDGGAVDAVYHALIEAHRVVVVTGRGGVDPQSCLELGRFAERFGAIVTNGCKPTSSYQCISYDDALYSPRRVLAGADLVIVLECEVPWIAGVDDPPADATVVVVDADPVTARVTLLDLPASRRLVSDTSRFCRALLAWADAHDTNDATEVFGRRREAVTADVARWRAEDRALPESRYRTDLIDPDWAAMAVSDALPEDAIVFDDTVYSAPVRRYSRLRGPAQYFCNNTTAGGWGVGAALGGALAQSERPVVSVIGDGFWTYGVPTSALWVARACRAPFLGIVFQNNSYNTGTEEVDRLHPTGYARRAGFPGGYFPQPVDFAMEAGATGAWGMNVTRAEDLTGAIANGIERVRAGQAAVIAIQLPRLLTDF
ncbi:MAG TPA: thiamine pyrophosphate-dependent enzyme, partial [Nevskiaceae bacterium]